MNKRPRADRFEWRDEGGVELLSEDGAHSEDDEGVSDEQMRVAQS